MWWVSRSPGSGGGGRPGNPGATARRAVHAAFIGLLAGALAACTVQPVYAPGHAGTPGPVHAELAAIEIDPAIGRNEQVFRNALIYGFRGADDPGAPRYKLNYRMVVNEFPLGVEEFTGTPTSYQIAGRVSFILEDHSTGTVVLTDRASAVASYDRSSQNFANSRARRDAEMRVAETLARLVQTRLASHFARQNP